jgi:Xaa-Pro aminopeptidase
MFQSFEETSTPQFGRQRVEALRAALVDLDVDGFLVPRADEFQGEYVPASAERLSWLTGFTGSAGIALVTRKQVIVFVDGRYVTQLAEQVDAGVFTGGDLVGEPPHLWLERHGAKGFRLGIDPWLHTGAEVRKLESALQTLGGALVLLDHNPLDLLWTDRPAAPLGRVRIQPLDQAGLLARDKLAAMTADIAKAGADAVILTDPSSIAWTFNIRGSDVPHTPHPLARAIVH